MATESVTARDTAIATKDSDRPSATVPEMEAQKTVGRHRIQMVSFWQHFYLTNQNRHRMAHIGSNFRNNLSLSFTAGSGFTRFLYIFFCGVVPTCSIFAFAVYYLRQHHGAVTKKHRKPPSVYVQQTKRSLCNVFQACRIASSAHSPSSSSGSAGNSRSYPRTSTKPHVQISGLQLVSSTNPELLNTSTELHL